MAFVDRYAADAGPMLSRYGFEVDFSTQQVISNARGNIQLQLMLVDNDLILEIQLAAGLTRQAVLAPSILLCCHRCKLRTASEGPFAKEDVSPTRADTKPIANRYEAGHFGQSA